MEMSTLVSGLPLGWPGYMLIGDGRPLLGTDIILADVNANSNSPCCNGRVFKIDRQTGNVSVLSVGSPGVGTGDPTAVALGPGGDFGTKLYVLDPQGYSWDPPFLYTINDDKSRSIFLRKPQIWTINTLPNDLAFSKGDFGINLYVADAAWPSYPYYIYTTPTIWRVTPVGELSPFVSGAPLTHPAALEFGSGGVFGTALYVLNTDNTTNTISIFKISADGKISIFASGIKYNSYMAGVHPDIAFSPDGNILYVGVGDKIIKIYQSNHPPVAVAGSDQVVECGNSVTLDGSGSNDLDGDALAYNWTWAGGSAEGATPTVTLPLGTTVVNLTVSDGKATATDTVNVTVQDKTPPLTTATGGSDNWYNANAISSFSAADSCSGVKEIHYTVNGTETIVLGDSASLTLTTDGTYNIAYYSIDKAGNAESPSSMTVKIDKTPPVLNLSTDTNTLWPPNHKMTDVTIGGNAADATSGIASVAFTVTDEYGTVQPSISNFNTAIQLEAWREGTDKDGRHYTITAVAADAAGNKTTTSSTVLVPHDQGKK